MTKYIFNSGGLRKHPDKAKDFYAEIVKGLGDNPKLLFCFFAKKREEWEEKFVEYSKSIKNLLPEDVQPIIELAMPDEFEKQVSEFDVVILYGGDDHLLQYWLKQFDVPKIWEGKVVLPRLDREDGKRRFDC